MVDMKNSVVVDGQQVSIIDAIRWAQDQFGHNTVRIEHTFPGWFWHFDFNNEQHATLFALKWIT
jgi:hypothetical protein